MNHKTIRRVCLGIVIAGLVVIAVLLLLMRKEERSSAKPQPEAEQENTPEEPGELPVNITITATGDCTFAPTQTHGYSGSFHQYYDNNGPEYFMAGVKDIFSADDFTLVNLECTLTTATNYAEKEYVLVGRPEYAKILPLSSIEGCSMANNHTLDCGQNGLEDTKEAVRSSGTTYAYYDEVGVYETPQGITIGIVSSSLLSQGVDREQYLQQGIQTLREQGVDLVIACCHWGVERTYDPTDYQVKMAHQCIDWGADLVIGNHPHVVQGIENYRGKVICYSLGNFCFGGNSDPKDKDTFLYQQTFTFFQGTLQEGIDAKIIPCTVSSVMNYNDYQPTLATGNKKKQILEDMRTYSNGLGTLEIKENGELLF